MDGPDITLGRTQTNSTNGRLQGHEHLHQGVQNVFYGVRAEQEISARGAVLFNGSDPAVFSVRQRAVR